MNGAARHRVAFRLGLAGSVLGLVAGLIQVFAGSAIPEWTGAKLATVPLGLLTVGLSVLAAMAARRQARSDLSVLGRAACALGLIAPGLLCLSTVGWLWYLPAVLLVVAGVLSVDHWRDTGAALVDRWPRVLLSAIGGCEILMAAGSSPLLLVVGAAGGIALLVAAWLPTRSWTLVAGLAALGTVPFAALGWTAGVPVLAALLGVLLTLLVVREIRKPPLSFERGNLGCPVSRAVAHSADASGRRRPSRAAPDPAPGGDEHA